MAASQGQTMLAVCISDVNKALLLQVCMLALNWCNRRCSNIIGHARNNM